MLLMGHVICHILKHKLYSGIFICGGMMTAEVMKHEMQMLHVFSNFSLRYDPKKWWLTLKTGFMNDVNKYKM